jgi:hypothetical protein
MKFEGKFNTVKNTILGLSIVYGSSKVKFENDQLSLKLTYQGSYKYGSSLKIKLKKLESNIYFYNEREIKLRNIDIDDVIFAGDKDEQIFVIHFPASYLKSMKINETIKGSYISINPGDRGTIEFTRYS